MNDQAKYTVKNSFHRPAERVATVLYEPCEYSEYSHIGILVMHSDEDYLSFSAGPELASRGFTVMCANVSRMSRDLDNKVLNAGSCVEYLKRVDGIDTVLLLGHSGGATLLTAYQSIAENGPSIYQHEGMLKQCPDSLAGLSPADGMLLLDPNWGNAAMRLFSLDPAIRDEADSHSIAPDLDLFNPDNGFRKGGSTYPDRFIERFFLAQHKRNSLLNEYALNRINAVNNGRGIFDDDEPMIIAGSEQGFFNNKLYAQDIRFMSRTKKPHILLHADGSETLETIRSLRCPENDNSLTQSLNEGAMILTVRNYLSSFAIRTTADYHYDESSVYGIDLDSNYNCTIGNIRFITVPLLIMGMTGSWEFSCCETIYENSDSSDKSLAYVEGADHYFRPSRHLEKKPGQFGDTIALTYDYVNSWIRNRF